MALEAGHNKKQERNVAQRLYVVIGIAVLAVLVIWGTMLRKGAVPDAPGPQQNTAEQAQTPEQTGPPAAGTPAEAPVTETNTGP